MLQKYYNEYGRMLLCLVWFSASGADTERRAAMFQGGGGNSSRDPDSPRRGVARKRDDQSRQPLQVTPFHLAPYLHISSKDSLSLKLFNEIAITSGRFYGPVQPVF